MSRESLPTRSGRVSAILVPVAVREKELQPHNKSHPSSLLTMNHTGKAVETTPQRSHVNARVGRPLLFRQNTSTVKANILRGRDLVGG